MRSPAAISAVKFLSYSSYTLAARVSARPMLKRSGPKPVNCVAGSKAPSPMAMPARLIRSAGGTALFRSWIVYATAGMYLPAYDSPVA